MFWPMLSWERGDGPGLWRALLAATWPVAFLLSFLLRRWLSFKVTVTANSPAWPPPASRSLQPAPSCPKPSCKEVKLKMMKTSNLLLRTPGLIACHGLLVLLLSSISTSSNQALLPRSLVRSISPLLLSLLAQLTLGGDGLWREQVNYRKFTSTYFSSCLPASAQPWWQPSPLVQRILASERGRIQGC